MFDCIGEEGAMLVLRDTATRSRTLKTTYFPDYMLKHHTTWVEYVRERKGLDIDGDDLVHQ